MKDNRDMHPMDDIQNQMTVEKNVTDMNTNHAEEQNMTCDMIVRHLIDYRDRAAGRDEDQMFDERMMALMDKHAGECEACGALMEQDKLLDELLNEIAAEDAKVIAPLEAQAAWRKAVRAEAAAQNETVKDASGSKIIRLNRWMRGIGSIAAALVVLVAGTYGMRLSENVQSGPESDGVYTFSETGPEDSTFAQRENIAGIMPGGYVTLGTYLQSDGSIDDQSDTQQDVKRGDDQNLSLSANGTPETQITANTSAGVQTANIQPVVLRSAERVIQSQDYDRDVQWLGDLVSEYEAYYEEKSETAAADEQTGRVSSMVIRVPSDRLDDFLMEMDQLGTTVMTREKAEDVTGRYMDSQSRLDVLQAQKNKLIDMMQSAQGVQDIVTIDAQLTDVVSEMERLEGDLRRWQSQQSYSSVTVTINEVFEQPLTSEASIGERMKAGFAESVDWLGDFGQDALVVLISMLPRLVVWVPAIVLAGLLIWAFTRRKKN